MPIFKHLAETSDIWKGVFTVIAGIAPATIAAIFGYMLPFIMRFLSHWSGAMSKGHLDKDVVRQLFFFLVVSLLWLYQLTEVFQFHGLLPYGYPVRGLLDGERSNRYTVVGYNIQFSRRCPRQDYKDIHFKQLLLVVLVPVSFSVKSDPFG